VHVVKELPPKLEVELPRVHLDTREDHRSLRLEYFSLLKPVCMHSPSAGGQLAGSQMRDVC